jgi:CRISPR/Cas system-associated exonuclease Cas4 (RecB family)
VTRDFQPCSFFAKNVWFRGVADLIIIDGDLAWVIDYKTGKSAKYADKGQLELMSLAVFAHYPKVKRVRAGLLFVISNNLIKENYVESQRESLWDKWIAKYNVMSSAFESDTWNPKPSGLCKRHCPVTECPHNGGNQ